MTILKKVTANIGSNVQKLWRSGSLDNDKPISNSLMVVFVIMLSMLALYIQRRPQIVTIPEGAPPQAIDMKIPKGQLLVPIEITNYEAVDSIVGNFSTIDLFSEPMDPESRSRRIAKKVKLYQPTKNINSFSILVTPKQASQILSTPGPYRATIRNPKSFGGTKIVIRNKKVQSRIQYLVP